MRPGKHKEGRGFTHPGLRNVRFALSSFGRLRAAPYPAIELLKDRLSVLVSLLVVAHYPELVCGEVAKTTGDLLHGQLVVALDREPGSSHPFLSIGDRDAQELRVGAQHFLGHLLEGLLLLLSLLLEGLALFVDLLRQARQHS